MSYNLDDPDKDAFRCPCLGWLLWGLLRRVGVGRRWRKRLVRLALCLWFLGLFLACLLGPNFILLLLFSMEVSPLLIPWLMLLSTVACLFHWVLITKSVPRVGGPIITDVVSMVLLVQILL